MMDQKDALFGFSQRSNAVFGLPANQTNHQMGLLSIE